MANCPNSRGELRKASKLYAAEDFCGNQLHGFGAERGCSTTSVSAPGISTASGLTTKTLFTNAFAFNIKDHFPGFFLPGISNKTV
jgi:hypothetical protein